MALFKAHYVSDTYVIRKNLTNCLVRFIRVVVIGTCHKNLIIPSHVIKKAKGNWGPGSGLRRVYQDV